MRSLDDIGTINNNNAQELRMIKKNALRMKGRAELQDWKQLRTVSSKRVGTKPFPSIVSTSWPGGLDFIDSRIP